MELNEYIYIIRKRIWVLLLVGVLAGGAIYVLFSRQAPVYEAHVTISVGTYLQSADPNTEQIRSSKELARTYAALTTTYELLQAAITETGEPLDPTDLREDITTELLPETSLLQITVKHEDAETAAALANAIANQLILQNPRNLTPEQELQLADAYTSIDKLNEQLREGEAWLTDIDQALSEGSEPYSVDLQWLITQRNTIVDHLDRLIESRVQYFDIVTTLEGRSNSLTVVESARVPGEPNRSNIVLMTGFGVLGGLALAVVVILMMEYLDDTIRTPRQLPPELGSPVLAKIPAFATRRIPFSKAPQPLKTGSDPLAECYRMLRTNVLFHGTGANDDSKPLFIMASPGAGEGKSQTVANLAASIAAADQRVLLIDADLRQPSIHRLFGLSADTGLSTLLAEKPPKTLSSARQTVQKRILKDFAQETQIPGLRVMASGKEVDNPAELLGLPTTQQWFEVLLSAEDVDVILVDTPASLLVPDAYILTSLLKAPVILLFRAGKTRVQAAQEAKEGFDLLDLTVKGVVLNGMRAHDLSYSYKTYTHRNGRR